MAQLIATAYNIKDSDYVAGGPPWLDWDRFDIVAKVPPVTAPERARLMLQNLLDERFKLVVHRDYVPVSTYLLTVANSQPSLKASGSEAGSCQNQPPSSLP